jgi:hypothetical protein
MDREWEYYILMAHFAKLDDNNVVLEVNVVNNDVLDASNEEASGIAFLTEWSGGHSNWKQTSYNGSFRKNYAGIGSQYRIDLDAFIEPKPFGSWVLNEDTCKWEPPVPYPTDDKAYFWDELTLSWIKVVTAP